MNPLVVSIASDFVCPWCYIGEHRLRRAIEQVPEIAVRIEWRPFQLNPWIPPGGLERRDYRIRKFGSWERSLQMDAHVGSVANAEGLPIDFARMQRTPSTFDLHRLMQLAQEAGDPTALARSFLSAYFAEGIDLNARDALIEVCVRSGLDASRVAAVLSSETYAASVSEAEEAVRDSGLSGVPDFVIGSRRFQGAVATPVLVDALLEAQSDRMPGSIAGNR